jgi:hypothetical protein
MITNDSNSILCRALGNELLNTIQLISESDTDIVFGKESPTLFLESQWDIRDFELLLDLTGNLDNPR